MQDSRKMLKLQVIGTADRKNNIIDLNTPQSIWKVCYAIFRSNKTDEADSTGCRLSSEMADENDRLFPEWRGVCYCECGRKGRYPVSLRISTQKIPS